MDKPKQEEKNVENQSDAQQSETQKSKWEKIQDTSEQLDAESLLNEAMSGEASEAEPESDVEFDGDSEFNEFSRLSQSELVKKLVEARQQAKTYWDDKMRLAAEMQNLSKRHQNELTRRAKFANEDFAKSLLTVMDSCVEGLKIEVDESNETAKATHEGLELIYKQILSVFTQFKIEEIDPVGQPFDPERHQAMLTQPSDQPPGTVLEVIQKGYSMHDRILRPARVIVAKEQ